MLASLASFSIRSRTFSKVLGLMIACSKRTSESGISILLKGGKNRLILINPNASDLLPQRRWAQQRFSELIQAIHQKYPDDLILITGSPAEFAYVEKVRAVANVKNALNFAGQVSFAELPPLYTLSDVMVSNDSGPGHFSAVTPLRTVSLVTITSDKV